jgi:hypothetical protein
MARESRRDELFMEFLAVGPGARHETKSNLRRLEGPAAIYKVVINENLSGT